MKRLMLPDKRPLDLVEGPSVLGLLDVLVLDRPRYGRVMRCC